jgi:putative restriction endonuclease
LARLQSREPRLISFADLERSLGTLLKDFGPPRPPHPEYPFWHLQTDRLWEIPERPALLADIARRPGKHNPRVSVIRKVDAHGGLPKELFDRLRRRPDLVNRIVVRLLEENFPQSVHEDLLDAVGMPWTVEKRRRDPSFRETILQIYSGRCAVCGFDGQLGYAALGLEAAHVRWHAAGGTDEPSNAVALCALHHKALDRGAISLDDSRRVLVSRDLRGNTVVEELILRYAGNELEPPQRGCDPPALVNIYWHRKEVFREPARR